ncbi:MAG TPA: DUF4331 domain-containing protein [Dehalococcoidia bacterium]|nr:DUF4331 domain-containing protein [Dehalococcoidia bacterium]
MSSHREAPEISADPVADNTDLYAFVSPDRPDTVTIIANYIPLEEPAGGPNFFNFGDDVLYEILIDNNADGVAEITYQFRFTTQMTNPNTFLYNTGPIASLTDKNWNLRQTYSVTRVDGDRHSGKATVLADGVPCPPCNIGPRSTPNYEALAASATTQLQSGETVFAGQRADAFWVDLGSIFDLGALRPVQMLHLIPLANAPGRNSVAGYNVHSIAIQIPKTLLTMDGSGATDPAAATSVIGVWAAASRQRAMMRNGPGQANQHAGDWVQVSRLGNPLINEAIIPMSQKDAWNYADPKDDAQFVASYQHPELATLLPVLYPTAFPNLAALNASGAARADLVAVLLTGIPSGIVPGFQNNTGTTQADLLRLNMAIPPTAQPNKLGLAAGDAAGFPNGRRLSDDITTIELRAVAGLLYPLIDKSFKPDDATSAIADGTVPDAPLLSSFPYIGTPFDGFDSEHAKPGPALAS